MKEPHDLRRILQESAAAPDVRRWFREHAMEREKLLVLLHQAQQPEEGSRQPRDHQPMFAEDELPVGSLLPPPGTYTFNPATPPIHAPGGNPLAQLVHIPDSLGTFLGAAFLPFGRRPRRMPANMPRPEEQIAYRMIGLVQYRGDEGEVVIQTSRPSPAALRHDLVLGNPCGQLRDGTPLFGIRGNHLRLRRDDFIIDLYADSGGITPDRLAALAEDTVLI